MCNISFAKQAKLEIIESILGEVAKTEVQSNAEISLKETYARITMV